MKKQKRVIFSILLFLVVLVLIYFIFFSNKIKIQRQFLEKDSNYSTEKLVFNSKGKEIYSLLFIPSREKEALEKFPVVIVLPGAEGTKESRKNYGEIFSEIGYATLILDQRGIGETGGEVNSMQQDFDEFASGNKDKISQYTMAQDVLSAASALSQIKEINKKKIVVLGESMGGRFAIISAALDKRIKAAIIISSAGYNFRAGNKLQDDFISYINPNSYISRISPRQLLMLHSVNDSVIPIEQAKYTFSLAAEPKQFIAINVSGCVHGYCPEMYDAIKNLLERI